MPSAPSVSPRKVLSRHIPGPWPGEEEKRDTAMQARKGRLNGRLYFYCGRHLLVQLAGEEPFRVQVFLGSATEVV